MVKASQVYCVYNKQNVLVAVGTSEADVWTAAMKSSNPVDILQTYFNLVKSGYYMELGFVQDQPPV